MPSTCPNITHTNKLIQVCYTQGPLTGFGPWKPLAQPANGRDTGGLRGHCLRRQGKKPMGKAPCLLRDRAPPGSSTQRPREAKSYKPGGSLPPPQAVTDTQGTSQPGQEQLTSSAKAVLS